MLSEYDITALLSAWNGGDQSALQQLMPLIYRDLHRTAHRYMRAEKAGHPLQTTALIHETYMRLMGQQHTQWQNRSHFIAVCAQLMRQILIDVARSRRARKRSGKLARVDLEQCSLLPSPAVTDLISLDEALKKLTALDARKGRVVEMRFFGGMGVEETAEALDISPDTVMRDWKFAKAWLLRELTPEEPA
jgi:RNA polymerase sigma-70 factor, ECF subfamily